MKNKDEKVIRVALRNGDDTKVKVTYHGGIFSPTEFTSLFMAILESYTEGLLATNTREDVFKYFNNVFGIFLSKILPQEKRYDISKKHKEFKEIVDGTLGREATEEDKMDAEENRLAAYMLCADILVNEVGLTKESADLILNRRLGLLKTPDMKNNKA